MKQEEGCLDNVESSHSTLISGRKRKPREVTTRRARVESNSNSAQAAATAKRWRLTQHQHSGLFCLNKAGTTAYSARPCIFFQPPAVQQRAATVVALALSSPQTHKPIDLLHPTRHSGFGVDTHFYHHIKLASLSFPHPPIVTAHPPHRIATHRTALYCIPTLSHFGSHIALPFTRCNSIAAQP